MPLNPNKHITEYTILMATYHGDNRLYLWEALNSIKEQTLLPFEVIVVIDGKISDENLKIIDEFSDFLKIKQIPLAENKGLGIALQIGLNYVNTEYVGRMDTDDISVPSRFEEQVKFLNENQQYDIVGSNVIEFHSGKSNKSVLRRVPETNESIINFAKLRSPFNHPSVMFRKGSVLKAGSYLRMDSFEDYYLWLRMIKLKMKGYNLQKPLLLFRADSNMIHRRRGVKYLRKELYFLKMVRKECLISFRYLVLNYIIRISLRLLPKMVVQKIYFLIRMI